VDTAQAAKLYLAAGEWRPPAPVGVLVPGKADSRRCDGAGRCTSAEQGQRDAQYCIGCCLARGQGVAVDWPQAALWLSKAFAQVRFHAAGSTRLRLKGGMHAMVLDQREDECAAPGG
jgi:hypothetical protein